MLRIGKLTDYATLIMSHMAKEPETVLSAASLSDILHLSAPTVSKILKILSEANLVSSTRGADGGYRLARDAHLISLADIVTAMEGALAMTVCCEKAKHCAIDAMCGIRNNWKTINKMIYNMLAKVTLIDMQQPLRGLPDGQ